MAGRLRDAATATRRGRRDDDDEDECESATTTSETTSATASLIGSSVIEFGREREGARRLGGRDRFGTAARRERFEESKRTAKTRGTFDVAENARLALEAKEAQLQKMAARLRALERERERERGREMDEERETFADAANDLEGEMAAAMARLRGDAGGATTSRQQAKTSPRAREDAGAFAFAPDAFASRDGDDPATPEMPSARDKAEEDDVEMTKTPEISPILPSRAPPSERSDAELSESKTPEPIKPGVRVDGGYLTPSGRVVGSALKSGSSKAKTPNESKSVAFTPGEIAQYSDAGTPFDAADIEELRAELREVRAALKSAFSVSEKLVAQCEKKNREIKEKNTSVMLAREELENARAALERAQKEAIEAKKSVAGVPAGDLAEAYEKSKRLNGELLRVMRASIGVNVELSPDVVFAILPTLASLAVRGDVAEAMAQGGALDALAGALDLFANDPAVCRKAIGAIESICRAGSSDASGPTQDEEIIAIRSRLTNEAVDTCGAAVARCARDHVADARLGEAICALAHAFAEIADFDRVQFLIGRECALVQAICKISTTHEHDERTQRASSLALAAFAACDENTKRVVETLGGIALIKRCVQELGIDDAQRAFPHVKRWISGKKTREDRERGARGFDSDDGETDVDVTGNL